MVDEPRQAPVADRAPDPNLAITSPALTAPMTATHATTARSLSVTHAPPLVDPPHSAHTKPTGWDADEITPSPSPAISSNETNFFRDDQPSGARRV